MYENGKMRHIEVIPGMGRRVKRRMIEGVNSTMICYCKNYYKCHNAPPGQQYNNK
jgi:hypothetical protein